MNMETRVENKWRMDRMILCLKRKPASASSAKRQHRQRPSLQEHLFSKVLMKKTNFFPLFDLIFWSGFLELFSRKESLEGDVVRVAVDRGFVGAGLNLLRLLGGERILSTVPDVHLQLCQYVEGGLELHLTGGTKAKSGLIRSWWYAAYGRELRCLSNESVYYHSKMEKMDHANRLTCTLWRKMGCYNLWAGEEWAAILPADHG